MGRSLLSILVVDDEPALAEAIAELLRAQGHIAATAGDGRQALQQATPGRFQLVLSDLLMPNMAGDELLSQLKARAGSPFWFVFMSSLSEDAVQARASGYDRFLAKPVRPDELFDLVADCARALEPASERRLRPAG